MSVVTVDEAAHRLGVSVATVRRRLSTGQLAGKKVGRDWQVEESGLPPVATRRPSGTSSSFTDDEIQRAIRHVSGTDVTELWIPDVLRWADYFDDGQTLITGVRNRLSSNFVGAASEVRVPKNALASRAGTMISLEDRIIYQAAVSRLAPHIEAATSEHVYSSRLSKDPRYFLLRSTAQYGPGNPKLSDD
jgi:excisionase family DNA binding protein